jgi:hypothetical protein
MNDALGRYIGQYQIIEFIARGDTAFVYKGFQPDMNRYVAVKILPPSLARDVDVARQFQRQSELMGQLDHRNILPVIDSGQEGAVSYVISHYAEGGTLRDNISKYQKPENLVKFLEPVTEALDYLHEQGLIHGNLTPDNILIDEEGQPLLTDINLPQLAGTMAGSVYISPEQGQGGKIDRRSDIYSLGVILYEIVVGEAPEVGVVPSPRVKRPDLPTDVEKVILRSMAQYPEQRFQTAAEFNDALQEAFGLQASTVQPAEPEAVEELAEPEEELEPEILEFPAPESNGEKDNRWVGIALGLLGLVIILCAIGTALFVLFLRNGGGEAAEVPLVTATVDTNVFSGPGPDFDILGILRQGQSARVLGLSPDGLWWLIVFPDAISNQGWVPDVAVTTQDVGNVPIVLPTSTIPGESPTEPPPTSEPTSLPPTLVPTQPPPTTVPPTLEPLPTEEPTEPYPPVPTDENVTPILPTATEEISVLPPLPTDTPIPLPTSPTESPPAVADVMGTPVEEPIDETGRVICGLPAIAFVFILVGLVRPYRHWRTRH